MIEKHPSGARFQEFEQAYIDIRSREQRVFNLEAIAKLPYYDEKYSHNNEWQLRQQSFERFERYVSTHYVNKTLLDIACGNGWFLNRMKDKFKAVTGVDVNLQELNQAEHLLGSETSLHYGHILDMTLDEEYDIITLLAGVQYFASIPAIIDKLLTLLKPSGEIHIYDSPIYKNVEASLAANQRTRYYYESQHASTLIDHYHHHTWEVLDQYNYTVLYKQNTISRMLGMLKITKSNPFPWIRITK